MKSIRRTGFADNLFDEWRYLDLGQPGQNTARRPRNPDFALNQPRYAGPGSCWPGKISAAGPAASMPSGRCAITESER